MYRIKIKNELLATCLAWVSMIEKQLSQRVKFLQSDNGGEYVGNEMKAYIEI